MRDDRWIDRYHEDGYVAPLAALSPEEARACRAGLEAFEASHGGVLPADLRHRSHVFLVWMDELVRHPRILDTVEAILGEHLLVWSSSFFIKDGGDGTYVPWHQDSRAYGARAPDVVTAWVALTDSTPENGALQVIPGSHRQGERAHVSQHVPNSLLTRRREIALGVNASEAVTITLRAGEMSLHHSSLLHGSPPNRARERRIGIAIRYARPSPGQVAGPRERALLVRGTNTEGFLPLSRPERDGAPETLALHEELMNGTAARPIARIGFRASPRRIALRGTLLARGGRAVLVCGPPGCGKSTLAAALARRGWTWLESGLDEGSRAVETRQSTTGSLEPERGPAPERMGLAAILLLGRRVDGAAGAQVSVMPPAHALLTLLRYRDAPDSGDLARGIDDVKPLVEAIPVYEGGVGSGLMAEGVELLLDRSSGRSPMSDPTIWADVNEAPATGPAGRLDHSHESGGH